MSHFIDQLTITISSGNGGSGSTSFRREKYIPKGGPDGGDGGKGGDVIFKTKPSLSSLSHLYHKSEISAENGNPGKGQKKFGKDGNNLIIHVPIGTVIKDIESNIIKELDKPNKEFLLFEGGKGGRGNTHFKSPTRQTPKFSQKGLPGKTAEIILEVKLIADLGLIGFPNAGKSTFLSKTTNAKPKIANYPFTTLTAQLGVFNFDIESSLIIADIPGIIENASKGVGLGYRFLKHIEKTFFLFYIIDISSKNPYEQLLLLQKELENYNTNILKKEFYIGLNKIDLIDTQELIKKVETFPKELQTKIIPFSYVSNQGITKIRQLLGKIISKKQSV